jgi:hypothetical protein
LGARECRVPGGTSGLPRLPISIGAVLLRALLCWYRHSVPRLLGAESRALGHRIRWTLQINAVERQHGRDLVREWMGQAPVSGSQNCKRACIHYMQKTESRYQFLSIFDLLLLQQAWKAGSEWNGLVDTSRSQDTSYTTPKSGNSVPPLAVQQPTKPLSVATARRFVFKAKSFLRQSHFRWRSIMRLASPGVSVLEGSGVKGAPRP